MSFPISGWRPRNSSTLGEYVLMPARMLGRVRDSDAEVTVDEIYVNKCRNGKIAEVRECRTKEEALEAVGLRE